MTLITVGVVLGLAAFVLWLLYTVIWHGVRRGLQEFQVARMAAATPVPAVPHQHHLHLPHRAPADVVPDYIPSDWV